jgi:hypothetical protein
MMNTTDYVIDIKDDTTQTKENNNTKSQLTIYGAVIYILGAYFILTFAVALFQNVLFYDTPVSRNLTNLTDANSATDSITTLFYSCLDPKGANLSNHEELTAYNFEVLKCQQSILFQLSASHTNQIDNLNMSITGLVNYLAQLIIKQGYTIIQTIIAH